MDINATAASVNSASKSQTSQGLVVQTYCESVLQQPRVDFSQDANLATFGMQIDNGLATAQSHANNYLNNIMPAIIGNVSNISNYYNLLNAVPATCPDGTLVDEWIEALTAVQQQSDTYLAACQAVAASLGSLNTDLGTDASDFATIVSNLNTAVNGDDGALQSISGQLDSIQGQIDGAIAGTALSALGIVGGVFMIVVGAVADFVTAGTSTPLVVGGVAVLAAGAGGEAASAVTLSNLNKEKQSLLTEQAQLTSEVAVALGISNAYKSLNTQVANAMTAVAGMQNAWESLSSDMASLVTDLQNGIQGTDAVRTLFLAAANGEISTVLADTTVIKNQMAGLTVNASINLSNTLDSIANGTAA